MSDTPQPPPTPPGSPSGPPPSVPPPPPGSTDPTTPLPPSGPPPGGPPPGGPPPGGPPPGGPGSEPAVPEPEPESGGGTGKIVGIAIALLLVLGLAAFGVFRLLGGEDDPTDEVALEQPGDDEEQEEEDVDQDVDEQPEEVDEPEPEVDEPDLSPIDEPIELGQRYEATLEGDRREARFTFDAPDSAMLSLEVINDRDSERRVIATLTSGGEQFARMTLNPGAEELERVILDHAGGGPFELLIEDGPARFAIEVGLELQRDAGQAGDAGDSFATGFEIEPGDTVEGLLGGQDRTDVYLLELLPGSELRVEFDNARDSERRTIVEVGLDGRSIGRESVNPGATAIITELFAGETEGTLEIVVTDGPANYRFVADLVEQQDGGQPGDASDRLDDLREVPVGEELPGQVGDDDTEDLYVFTATAGAHTLTVVNEPDSPRRVIVTVDDESGASIARASVNPGSTEVLDLEVGLGGDYRISVTDGRADYRFEIG